MSAAGYHGTRPQFVAFAQLKNRPFEQDIPAHLGEVWLQSSSDPKLKFVQSVAHIWRTPRPLMKNLVQSFDVLTEGPGLLAKPVTFGLVPFIMMEANGPNSLVSRLKLP